MSRSSIPQSLRHRPLALCCLALAGAPVLAADEAQASFEVGRVVISAPRSGPLSSRKLLTSVDLVHAEPLAAQTVQSTWELFSLVPGALLTGFNQGTTSGKVSLRGFNGEGEVNAVKLLIDGVPANSNDGNMPYLDMVFPLQLQTIELVRGTNDARFGLHNLAGNVNLATQRGGNDLQARVALGSFNSQEIQLAKGIESGGWTQNYFIGHKRSDGWREHAEAHKTALAAQWFYNTAAWQAGLVLRHLTHDAQEPGYLTLADARQRPEQSYAFVASDGGQRELSQVALHLDAKPAPGLDASVRLYQNRFADSRWVKFSATVSQQERVTDETHTGARASLSWRPAVAGLHDLVLEGGADVEHQDNRSQRYNSLDRVRQAQTRNQAWTLDATGAYLQAVVQALPSLKLVPAWRVDRFGGAFGNLLAGSTAPINGYGTVSQPKLSAVWSPSDAASLYGNWGRSFQIGVGAASFKIPPRSADLAPSINDGWELGLKFKPGPGLDGRLAIWQQKASDEVRRKLNDPSGDSDNIGATRRRGLDLQLAVHGPAGLEAWTALTLQRAVIITPDPAAPATRGNEIDHVPHQVFNLGVDWVPAAGWKLSAWGQGQGDYYLDRNNNTGRFGAYAVLNLGARWQLSPSLALEAQLRNAGNRATEYVWHDGSQSLHSPGAPRALSLAISSML